LAKRAHDARICVFPLDPVSNDFNDDLLNFGARVAVRFGTVVNGSRGCRIGAELLMIKA
jgi:hypothetical protein